MTDTVWIGAVTLMVFGYLMYALLVPENTPEKSFQVIKRTGPMPANPFTPETAPIRLRAEGKRIEAWRLDSLGLAGPLQDSPVKTEQPTEAVTLIPMGAARLRISAFPVVGQGGSSHQWTTTSVQ